MDMTSVWSLQLLFCIVHSQHAWCGLQGQEAPITGILAGIQQRGGYGYPELRNITLTVEQARGLPVSTLLEKFTCGQVGTYVRPSVRVIDTLTGRCVPPVLLLLKQRDGDLSAFL